MREFFREIVHALEEGRPVELVSIAASDGSTPRGAGAMMAVFPGGGITGTIGGGNVEFECQRLAAELLERGGDALRQFRFTLGDAASLGMVCGGGVTVQFQYLPAGEQRIIAVLRDLIEADGGNRDTWLLRRIEGEQVTAMGLADRTGPRHLDILPEELELLCGNQAVFARKWLSIPVVKAGRTYLFGGGHVSQALPAGVPQLHIVGPIDVVCLHLHLLSIHIDGLPGGHRNDTRCRSAAAERRTQCHAGEQQSHLLSSVVHSDIPLFSFGQ